MKALPFIIPKPNKEAIVYEEDFEYIFYDKFHQHEEIQLSYIAKGEGTLIVGDTINNYTKGDILVLGSNLPHVFKSEKSNTKSLMLSLFFTKNSFGNEFFALDELQPLKPFFKKVFNGFKVVSHNLQHHFIKLKHQNKFERFINLLQLLEVIQNTNYQPLSTFIYEKQYSEIEGKRMRTIMEYSMNNFQSNISLETIASLANMTKNAFCKYFKKRTNKTYVQFLTELRIENACKFLLTYNDSSINEIAEFSGFNNLSNFNRQFKKLKNTTPVKYINKRDA
tara:strand:- start:722 stop:1561 length:840 start_codon:yes stop_codon:yes gene_type:complete